MQKRGTSSKQITVVVSMTTTWCCHRFESWLVYGDPSLGLPATLVEEIGLKIVNSHFYACLLTSLLVFLELNDLSCC
jgi:hypothetical protein